MSETYYDWTRFNKKIAIKVSVKEVYEHWISQDNLEKWFLSSAQFYSTKKKEKGRREKIQSGDSYTWMWHGSDNIAHGEVFGLQDDHHLNFSFLGCKVSVDIKEIDSNISLLDLCQFDTPTDEQSMTSLHLGCTRGWTFYMTNLKSILEGGIDLRNRDKSLNNVINT